MQRWDFVTLSDGTADTQQLSGADPPPAVTASGHEMSIGFTSDGNTAGAGFQASIVCTQSTQPNDMLGEHTLEYFVDEQSVRTVDVQLCAGQPCSTVFSSVGNRLAGGAPFGLWHLGSLCSTFRAIRALTFGLGLSAE